MTDKAISLLRGDPEGFFLQVEGGSLDYQETHQNSALNVLGTNDHTDLFTTLGG